VNGLAFISSASAALAVFLAALSVDEIWLMVSRRYVNDLEPRIVELSIDRSSIPSYLRWWGIVLLACAALALYAPPLAIVAIYFTWIAPRLWIHYLIWNRKRTLRNQMVAAAVGIANAARAGLSLPLCFKAIAADTPPPLRQELQRIYNDFEQGLPLVDAINNVKNRLKIDSFSLFAPAIVTAETQGGNITDALERISFTLQEIQRLERKVDADTAAGRKTVWFLSLFPLFFLALFLMIFPDGTSRMFTTWLGQILLAVVLVMIYISIRWSLRILAIDF
jgi:tight adherence protein B